MALALTYEGPVSNLTVGSPLSGVSASCLDWSDALVFKACIVSDMDGDGVPDARDFCPATTLGTIVNAYGCPIEVAQCTNSTGSVTFNTNGGTTGVGITTRYVLTTNTGTILQINPTSSFTGLTGSATYMALALAYEGPVSNLTVGSSLSGVSASCLDWSDALVFKACVAPPVACDYQVGDAIVLRTSGGSTGTGVQTRYVLTDAAGKLVSLSTTPSFSSAALVAGTYRAYALTFTDDNSLENLVVNGTNTLSQVRASCLVLSTAFSLQLCGACPTACIPILITRLR